MGSKVAFVAIFTKFGGKKPFCKLLKDLSSGFAFFYIELPVRPLGGAKGVKWGSKGGQKSLLLQSSPNLVGKSLFASY